MQFHIHLFIIPHLWYIYDLTYFFLQVSHLVQEIRVDFLTYNQILGTQEVHPIG